MTANALYSCAFLMSLSLRTPGFIGSKISNLLGWMMEWTRKMIDCIIISCCTKSSIRNCSTYWSAALTNADHKLVFTNFRFRQKSIGKATVGLPKFEWSNLEINSIHNHYGVKILNTLERLSEYIDAESTWTDFRSQIIDADMTLITPSQKARKPWISVNILIIIEQNHIWEVIRSYVIS